MKSRTRYLIAILLVVSLCSKASHGHGGGEVDDDNDEKKKKGVTYDGTSLIINGKRELLFSVSVHYPRSTPDMWPSIIDKARIGGLNTIQTYVFWNVHEPEHRKEKGLYVTLRLGPFIQAEWNHGGLPYWLREVPEVYFRTDNEPFKEHTERYVRKILGMMKEEKLLASQRRSHHLGTENECNAVQLAYKENGERYIKWAANLVESMKLGIPWALRRYFPGTKQTRSISRPYGPRTGLLSFEFLGILQLIEQSEDIAFSVARYFSKNGSHVNYYMYHGGTNFGRTSAHFVTTRYYDDAPLDEYGMEKAPKYGHLKRVHRALRLCKKALFWGHPRNLVPTPRFHKPNNTLSGFGKPELNSESQLKRSRYHIPRSFMKEEKKKNMLVILEEEPGVKLEAIDFVLVNRDTICSYVGEDYPVSVKSWKRERPKIASRSKDMRLKAVMKCPPEKQMVAVEFASFGDPTGTCGNFTMGKCSASKSKEVVEKECLGENHCSIVVARETFGDKGCPEIVKTLAVQIKCEKKEGELDEKKKKEDNDEEEEEDDDEDR
ncbi:unnamed protein product [Arabidopsis lyrata]|nr:unnamed protein product [Arabidopsis lyrata]